METDLVRFTAPLYQGEELPAYLARLLVSEDFPHHFTGEDYRETYDLFISHILPHGFLLPLVHGYGVKRIPSIEVTSKRPPMEREKRILEGLENLPFDRSVRNRPKNAKYGYNLPLVVEKIAQELERMGVTELDTTNKMSRSDKWFAFGTNFTSLSAAGVAGFATGEVVLALPFLAPSVIAALLYWKDKVTPYPGVMVLTEEGAKLRDAENQYKPVRHASYKGAAYTQAKGDMI